MASHEKVGLEVSRKTKDRLLAVMKTLHSTYLEKFLNDLLENIEITGIGARWSPTTSWKDYSPRPAQ
jgi:hypothetical protein